MEGRGSRVSQVGLELLIHRPLSAGITGDYHSTRYYYAVLWMKTRSSEQARQAPLPTEIHPQLKFPLKVYVNFWPFKSLPHPTPPQCLSILHTFSLPTCNSPSPPTGSFSNPLPVSLYSLHPSLRNATPASPSVPVRCFPVPPRHISAAGDLPPTASNARVPPAGLPDRPELLRIPSTPNPLLPGSTHRRPEQVVQTKLPTVMST